jgi:hypothetical protein
VKNKYHKPSSNGCGSLGVQVRLLSSDLSTFVLFINCSRQRKMRSMTKLKTGINGISLQHGDYFHYLS